MRNAILTIAAIAIGTGLVALLVAAGGADVDDTTVEVSLQDTDDVGEFLQVAEGGMQLAEVLPSSSIEDFSVVPGGREELELSVEQLRWEWVPDQTGDDGQLVVEANRWSLPGGQLDAEVIASVRQWSERLWAVDVTADTLACDELLKLFPADWIADLGQIDVQGRADPWMEVRLHDGPVAGWDVRLGGVDDCRVTGVEHLPNADWLPGGALDGLNERFSTTTAYSEEVEVGPATPGYVELDELPVHVPAAMYLSEEPGFWESDGWSPDTLGLAIRRNLARGEFAAGGSSITQQLVKNLFLSPDRTLERKARELVLAMAVAETSDRERILELYVNVIEFGPGVFGIDAAADYYFAKEPGELQPVEAAFLASLKPQPDRGARIRETGDIRGIANHVSVILDQLHRAGIIDKSTAAPDPAQIEFAPSEPSRH